MTNNSLDMLKFLKRILSNNRNRIVKNHLNRIILSYHLPVLEDMLRRVGGVKLYETSKLIFAFRLLDTGFVQISWTIR